MLVAQLCLTLCDPADCSSPVSSVHGILQAQILEWDALLSPGDVPSAGIEPGFPALQTDSLPSESPGKPLKPGLDLLNCFQQMEYSKSDAHKKILASVLSCPLSLVCLSDISCYVENFPMERSTGQATDVSHHFQLLGS